MAEPGFYVITYDIVDDRRRLKLAKYLESVGDRVQASVFEAYLTPVELDKMLKKAGKILDAEEDGLRVYFLCSACRGKVRTVGRGVVTPLPGVHIV
jgi:CRISPR-associated protein Cas2